MNDYLGNLTTESVNERTKHIDECSRIYLLIRLSTFGGVDLCQYFGHKKLNFSPSITYAERIIS